MHFLRNGEWTPCHAWRLRSWVETLTQQISKHSSTTLLPEPHSDNKRWEYSEKFRWIHGDEHGSEWMVLHSRSGRCHFSWWLRLTGPVTENRSLNQLTGGGAGDWQKACQRSAPESSRAPYICWKQQQTFHSCTWRTHRNHPFRRLYWFFTPRQKKKNLQSIQVWTSGIVIKLEQHNCQFKQSSSVHT